MFFFHLNRQFLKHLKPKQCSPDRQHWWCVLKVFQDCLSISNISSAFSFWCPSHNSIGSSLQKEQTNFCKTMLLFEYPACCHKDGSWLNGIWNLWDRHMVVCRLRLVFFMMYQMLFESQRLVELTLPAQLWHCGQPSVSLAKCILIYWIPAATAARNGQEKLSKDAKTGLWSIDNHSVFSKERR